MTIVEYTVTFIISQLAQGRTVAIFFFTNVRTDSTINSPNQDQPIKIQSTRVTRLEKVFENSIINPPI